MANPTKPANPNGFDARSAAEKLGGPVPPAPPVSMIAREIMLGVSDVVHGEFALALQEAGETGKKAARHAVRAAIFGIAALFAVLPFMAFLVIGLGLLMNGNYWASSLIVAVAVFSIGGYFSLRSWKRLQKEDLSMPVARQALDESIRNVDTNLRVLADFKNRRIPL